MVITHLRFSLSMRSFNFEQVERHIVSTSIRDADVTPPKIDSKVTVKPLKRDEKVGTSVNKKKSLKKRRQTETGVEQA